VIETSVWRLCEHLRLMYSIVDRVQTVAFMSYRAFHLRLNVYKWRTSGDTMDHVPWLISTVKF
jgi:hypothetical protein